MLIRKMMDRDRDEVFLMMRQFYDSPALIHKSSDRVLRQNIDDCIGENFLIDGYVFEENNEVIGYAMCSKCYTTEYGGLCIWLEDLFFKREYRKNGRSTEFFAFLEKEYKGAVRFKLEVEEENEAAVAAYIKNGYSISGYKVMTKEMDEEITI